MDIRAEDLSGKTFGKLTALSYVKRAANGAHWYCSCACGNFRVARAKDLKTLHVRSCGCLHSETVTKHSDSNSSEYRTWDSLKRRCYNPTTKYFDRYGGRGIQVCARWRDDYQAFLSDMGRRPSPRHSLDRIDNDGDYELSNCRWTLQVVQIRNRSIAVIFDWHGKHRSQMELAELSGIPFGTLRSRIKRGWTLERAMMQPLRLYGKS